MNGKRMGGIACLVLAALLAVGGINTLGRRDGPGVFHPSGLGVSRLVGAFALPMLALVAGLSLLKKPDPDGPA